MPSKKLILDSTFEPNEVKQRLEQKLSPRKMFRFFSSPVRPFEGEITQTGFHIFSTSVIFDGSFSLEIKADIQKTNNSNESGCQLALETKYHSSLRIFLLAYFWLCTIIFVSGFFVMAHYKNVIALWISAIALCMFVFGKLVVNASFRIEYKSAINILKDLFHSRIREI